MSAFEEYKFTPAEFSGIVRLFPIPNLVMFPHVMQPLHVFEPRYRDLLEDALANDRLIAMAVLEPGWESDYEGQPFHVGIDRQAAQASGGFLSCHRSSTVL